MTPRLRIKGVTLLTSVALVAGVHAARASRTTLPCAVPTHSGTDHGAPRNHGSSCGFREVGSVVVSNDAGLGQVEVHGKLGAVLQRDEGIVALLDLADPARPRVLGRYDDDAKDSFDGDLAFSSDGNWLFYARQTHQFSKDGVHVLDVSDPAKPRLASYQPQGGTFRIAYYEGTGAEWVVSLDAIHGLVINRFDRATGQLVPVHIDALPALKVGGPASAGVSIDRADPMLGVPVLYASTGRTGVQMFDFSNPAAPRHLGSWAAEGLAAIEVRVTKSRRTIYAATEYWFKRSRVPQIVVLDATKPEAIEEKARWELGVPDDLWRVQGMELAGDTLYVAHSHAGFLALDPRGAVRGVFQASGTRNENAAVQAAPYAMDVDSLGSALVTTDAATGRLSLLRPRACC